MEGVREGGGKDPILLGLETGGPPPPWHGSLAHLPWYIGNSLVHKKCGRNDHCEKCVVYQ